MYLQRYSSCLIVILLPLLLSHCSPIKAKKLMLRPLNAREVYRILRNIEREDAVPEGRVVSQGIAAFTGFTLGLKKGIGASILYDIITANVTGLLQENGTSTATTGAATPILPQEICFKTRNARGLRQTDAVASENRNQIELRAVIYEEDDDDDDDDDDADDVASIAAQNVAAVNVDNNNNNNEIDEEEEEEDAAEEPVKPTNHNTKPINNQLQSQDKFLITSEVSEPEEPMEETTSPTVDTFPGTQTLDANIFSEGTSNDPTTFPESSVPGFTTDSNTPTAIITPDIPSPSGTTCIVVRRR